MINIVCIGSGNMGFALIKGMASKTADAAFFFTDIDPQKAKEAAGALGAQFINTNLDAAEKGDFIFLAVKPQALQQVLDEITPAVQKKLSCGNPPVIVSMAAGWPIEKIQLKLQGCKLLPVVRIMPNTPALIGKGMIALSASPEVTTEQKDMLAGFLGNSGLLNTVEENLMDAVTALSGSGPAFVFMFIEALADGGVLAGLPREKAVLFAAQTVLGSASMVLETGGHPGALKDMVASPGGTTIAGLSTLEDGAFRGAVIRAVEAAWKRAKELIK